MDMIHSREDMAELIKSFGILPFFKNKIPGFSLEEHTPEELLFAQESAWMWKGPVIQGIDCAYGKFFWNKSCFITREFFYDFANFRRDGYDLDARWEDGLISHKEKTVYEVLETNGPMLSWEWRRLTGIEKRGEFDSIVTKLQMKGYVITVDFVYQITKNGVPYGIGVAKYSTPEQHWGEAVKERIYSRTPSESRQRLQEHLARLYPDETKCIDNMLGK